MYTKSSVPKRPTTFSELMIAIVSIAKSCQTGEEASDLLQDYLTAIQSQVMLTPSMAYVRSKAYVAAAQRRASIPFELRWHNGGGEIVEGWDALVKRLKELDIHYRVATLKSRLSGERKLSRTLVNPDTDQLDILTVLRPSKAQAKLGRPQGSTGRPRQTHADRVQAIANPIGNKLRNVTREDDLA